MRLLLCITVGVFVAVIRLLLCITVGVVITVTWLLLCITVNSFFSCFIPEPVAEIFV